MLSNPKLGNAVQVWYAPVLRDALPLHGQTGVVTVRSRGRPRNHGVRIDGRDYVVPAGNLRKPTRKP
jgi:hypothetical protein